MQLIYTEDPDFQDLIHKEDLKYMIENTYTDTSFFLQTITHDGSTYTFWGDIQKNLFFVSDNLRDGFGFERNIVPDLLTVWSNKIYNPIDRTRYFDEIKKLFLEHGTEFDMRYQVVNAQGRIFWVHCFGQLKWSEDGQDPLFFCGKVSEQDKSLMTDPISSFAGEPILNNHLAMLDKSEKSSTCIGFRLNNISKINSVQGRAYGNQLIANIAHDLTANCPTRMPFYRLSGKNFVAVLSHTVGADYKEIIEQIRKIIDTNYKQMGVPVEHACSFAVMDYPKSGFTPMDFIENMRALIRLSTEAPNEPFLDEQAEGVLQMQRQTNMELLLNKNVLSGMSAFRAVVQPVVSTKTGKIIGGEVLLRWKEDDIDISPAVFIPIMEKSALIQIAGRWVFEQAVKTCKQAIEYMPDFYLTVNVSLRQLYDPEFFDFIPAVLKKHGLSGKHIVVEMTESCIDQEPEKVIELFKICDECGIRIALDDFGTGYSSMQVLLKYPLSIVKIDRSLLLEMSESQKKYNFISSIVFACHQFGKTVCIEGVENEKQRELSCYAGCDMIQGFYYYKPTELDQLIQVIRKDREEK